MEHEEPKEVLDKIAEDYHLNMGCSPSKPGLEPRMTLYFCQSHSMVEMVCTACGQRWINEDSHRLYRAYVIGFNSGVDSMASIANKIRMKEV